MSRKIILIKQELLLLVYELNRSGLLAENEKIRPILADRKSGSAGMPRPISYAVFCLKKKSNGGFRGARERPPRGDGRPQPRGEPPPRTRSPEPPSPRCPCRPGAAGRRRGADRAESFAGRPRRVRRRVACLRCQATHPRRRGCGERVGSLDPPGSTA